MGKNFCGCQVPVAAFLPFNPSVFVAANSNAVLRLVNAMNGQVLQKLKVETEVLCGAASL